MIFLYAIDPRCFFNWESARYLVDNLGVQNGRVVKDCPNRKWIKEVDYAIEQNENLTEMKRKYIREKIIALKNGGFLIRGGLQSDSQRSLSWRDLAREMDKVYDFRSIIIEEEDNLARNEISITGLNNEDERWKTQRSLTIERTAEEIQRTCRTLVNISRRIKFIDPLFYEHLREGRGERWLKIFRKMNLQRHPKSEELQIEIHSRCEDVGGVERDSALTSGRLNWYDSLAKTLPTCKSCRLILWPRNKGMHARYVITERGGILYEHGLDEKRGSHTDVFLLDFDHWRRRFDEYEIDGKQAGEFIVYEITEK